MVDGPLYAVNTVPLGTPVLEAPGQQPPAPSGPSFVWVALLLQDVPGLPLEPPPEVPPPLEPEEPDEVPPPADGCELGVWAGFLASVLG